MKICYLIPGCGVSGGIAVVCQHANRLQKRGHTVFLVCESSERRMDWFPGQQVPIIGLEDFPDDADALIATSWSTSFRVSVLPARHKFYFVQSDETRFHPTGSIWEHLTRLSYTVGFNYLTEARWIQKWLMDGFGHEATLVPNGLDGQLFHPTEPLEPKGSRPRILLEGAIGLPYKGMREAFAAVSELDAEVWCVSSYGKPESRWRCDRFFEQVPMAEMRRVYSSCDILLKLSRVEGFFGPPMEMMACGGCVVVGKVTGYDEYIEDGVNALVVEADRPDQAAAAIRRILEEPGLRDRLIENGLHTAAQWQWEPSIDKLEARLKSVVEQGGGTQFNTAREALARSVAYFYQSVAGVNLMAPMRDKAPAVSSSDPTTDPAVTQQFQESGATEKLLSWLRQKPLFRRLAVLAWRIHLVRLKIKRLTN